MPCSSPATRWPRWRRCATGWSSSTAAASSPPSRRPASRRGSVPRRASRSRRRRRPRRWPPSSPASPASNASTSSPPSTGAPAAASRRRPIATCARTWRRASPAAAGGSSPSRRSRPRSRRRSSLWSPPRSAGVRKALAVCRRELAALTGGPLAWVLGAVFVLLTGYFFYSDLVLFVTFGGANQTPGLWRFVFLDFRLVALLVLPLLTMRLFAEERKLGTLELL